MTKFIVLLSALVVASIAGASPALSAVEPPSNSPSGPIRSLQPTYASVVGPTAFADCPASYSCYWMGDNGTGARWDAPSCGIWLLGGSLNNNIESVRNRGGGTVHLYDAGDALNGYMRSVVNNGANVELSSAHDNRTSSIRIDC